MEEGAPLPQGFVHAARTLEMNALCHAGTIETRLSLELGSLLLAQGVHGAWFPARIAQKQSTAVLVALQSDLEEHSEWVPLRSGRRCASAARVRRTPWRATRAQRCAPSE